jgi:hypothetical protein
MESFRKFFFTAFSRSLEAKFLSLPDYRKKQLAENTRTLIACQEENELPNCLHFMAEVVDLRLKN